MANKYPVEILEELKKHGWRGTSFDYAQDKLLVPSSRWRFANLTLMVSLDFD